jgi:hypothetical protein
MVSLFSVLLSPKTNLAEMRCRRFLTMAAQQLLSTRPRFLPPESYKAFDSTGEAEESTGTIDGDTWTWISEEHFGPTTLKGRYTMKVLSPTLYTMRYELSPDGKQWTTGMEGRATKK